MSTTETVADENPVELTPEDIQWFGLLKELPAWKFHWLMKSHREEEMHFEFITAHHSLEVMRAKIDKETMYLEPRTSIEK